MRVHKADLESSSDIGNWVKILSSMQFFSGVVIAVYGPYSARFQVLLCILFRIIIFNNVHEV